MTEKITINFIFQFMLVFIRLGTALSYFPAIESPYIFSRGRLALALCASYLMTPILQPYLPQYSENFTNNIGYLAIELLVGFIISIAANIYMQCLHYVGQIISMQSGLSSASFFDPAHKSQVAIFSNFMLLATAAFIFASDIHYLLIQSFAESYKKFPPGEIIDTSDLTHFITHVVNDSFILAFKISSPFVIVILAIMVGSGTLARLMPNLQVFFIITPAQILAAFGTMYIVIDALLMKITYAIKNSINFMNF